MNFIKVPQAQIYYESQGSGPPMVLIPGATGTASSFRVVAALLAERYRVITYDRRGFSRSRLDGPQDCDRRLEMDADDVRMLIEAVADEPAVVFGASSGGIVGLETLVRHPDAVRSVVSLEPPLVAQLPDGQRTVAVLHRIYDLYRREGPEIAMIQWREEGVAFTKTEALAVARATKLSGGSLNAVDLSYWFEHELRQYPTVELDLDALKVRVAQILLAVGRDSKGHPAHEAGMLLGRKLGASIVEFPGGHGGYMTRPNLFARELMTDLANSGLGIGNGPR